MSGIDGLNVFGSLTTQSGQKLELKDIDQDGDGVVTSEELQWANDYYGLDLVELSGVDQDGDKVISEDEFANLEQKVEIQDALNDLKATISKDFTGTNSSYITDVTAQLKDFTTEFVANYTGDASKMVESYKEELAAKYEEVKTEVLSNTPSAVKSRVLDNLLNELPASTRAANSEITDDMSASITKTLGKKLETLAEKFIKEYTGDNLEADLQAYLETALNASDAEKMEGAIANYRAGYASFGAYIDSDELESLKDYAKEFLQAALDQGLTLRLNDVNITTTANIDTVLKKYTDADTLNNDIEKLISGLSTKNIKDAAIEEKIAEKEAAAVKAFQSLTGTDVQVNTEDIDYSKLPGYYENSTTTVKKQGKDGAKDDAVAYLETNLKEQIKAQVKADLEAKGVSYEQFEQIFENVFTQSAWDTANACVSGKKGGLFRHSSSSFNVPNLVNTFITTFNTNIAATINEMNKSNTDMDLQDINYETLVTDESTGEVDNQMLEAMENGSSVTRLNSGRNNTSAVDTANKMIERLKSTMMAKAMAMCEANGVEFDKEAFTTRFNNAKASAVVANTSDKNVWILPITQSTVNPKQLVSSFTTSFKESYTAWVEAQKAAAKNA